jgi:hypothetical protein
LFLRVTTNMRGNSQNACRFLSDKLGDDGLLYEGL